MVSEEILASAKIDPELEQLLEKTGPLPRFGGDVYALRERLSQQKKDLTKELSSGPPATIDEFDYDIPGRDGHHIPCRIYRPKTAPPTGSPLIIMFHGGGFALGGLENEELNCRSFSEQYGASVINVDYRLAPEHPFPAAVNDAWDVTKWAAANVSEEPLVADASRGFILAGTSAGAQLSDVVAHLAADERLSPPLTGVLLMIPPLMPRSPNVPEKYKAEYQSFEQNRNAPGLDAEGFAYFEQLYKADPQSWYRAPLSHPNGHGGIPPVYFQLCGMDPVRDDGVIYDRVLREEYGQKTKLVMYNGFPHGFFSMFPRLEASKRFVRDTAAGIGWLLENGKPAVNVE